MKKVMVFVLAVFLILCISIPAIADVSEINFSNDSNVVIEELGVSFKVPGHIEWATRTDGNYEIMEKTYGMDQEALIAFMEASDEYCKGVDPNSDIRFLYTLGEVDLFEKNYSVLTDDEVLKSFEDREMMTVIEIYNTDDNKFAVVTGEAIEGQLFYVCYTVVDGMLHSFVIRGTNDGYKQTLAYYLMETMTFETKEYIDTADQKMVSANFSTTGTTFLIPESWECDPYEFSDSLAESICFIKRGSDGLLRSITCNVTDLCEAYGFNELMRPSLYGNDKTKQLVISFASQFGVDTSSITNQTFNNKNFYGYMYDNDGIATIQMYILENGYWYGFAFESLSDEDPYKDECYQDFENVLSTVELNH